MGARYYNPTIGRFITPDNVLPSPTDSLSYDRYAYTRNNPINLIDPTGNFPSWIAIAIAAVISGYQALKAHAPVLTGMLWGAAQAAAGYLGGAIGVMVLAAIHAEIYGGNPLRAALIAGATFAVSYIASSAFSSLGQSLFPTSSLGQGVVNIIGSGVVGGFTSVALGGKFAEGFAYGAAAAGLSYAANEIAGEIEEHYVLNQKKGNGPTTPSPENTIPKRPESDWNTTLQNADVTCEMQSSAERSGLTQKNATNRVEESVVMISNKITGTYRIAIKSGNESQTMFEAGAILSDEEIVAIWHVHTYNGRVGTSMFWENPNYSPSDVGVYGMMSEAPWAGNMYVVGPIYIWHYNPLTSQFIPVAETSKWLSITTYPK